MRQLATVRRIATLSPVENSDRLEVATLHGLGWQVVVARGEYKVGQQVVFFEIDSALPIREEFEFLRDRCYRKLDETECFRLRTVKLRGVISQGLILPTTLLYDKQFPDGTDVTGWLNVRHYDELLLQHGPNRELAGSGSTGSFPSFVPKTDEDRIQNHPEYFDGRFRNTLFEVTEKADGSSMTVVWSPTYLPDDPFQVYSRNFRRNKNNPDNQWMKPLVVRDLEARLREYGVELALQGELVGPGINGNRDKYTEYRFLVFNIWDIEHQKMLRPNMRYLICRELGVEHVKVVDASRFAFLHNPTLDSMLEFTKGNTDRGNPREGLVFKSDDFSFKVINNDYLLKEKE